MKYALNVTEMTDHCEMCGDTGVVELAGTVKQHGVVYSRGSTMCKWCEQGRRRYERAVSPPRNKDDKHRPWQPETNYDAADVVMPDLDPRPYTPDADFLRMRERDFGTPREVMWTMKALRKVWPKEWPRLDEDNLVKPMPKRETAADVERNRKKAQDAISTVELPPDPALHSKGRHDADPFNPPVTDDDLPF